MTTDRTTEQSGPARTGGPRRSRWAVFRDRLPLRVALLGVAAVWLVGCVWSFEEQTRFAQSKQFQIPQLLPVVIDGLAISLAAVAYAASLDGRPATFSRLGTGLAIAGSATSNAAWAWVRTNGDVGTIALAIAVPVAANLAFEVLLAELRHQVLRRRGLPAPVKVPYPRLVRLGLAPWSTFWTWRRLVLEVTDLQTAFDDARSASQTSAASKRPDRTARLEQADEPEAQTGPATPDQADEQTGPAQRAKRTAPRKQTAAAPVRRLHAVRSDRHSTTAIADAQTIRVHYKGRRPGRNEVVRDFGWGGEKASNALKALDDDADKEQSA